MDAQCSGMQKLSPNCSFGLFWSIRFKKQFPTNYCQNVNKSRNEVLNMFCKHMKNGLKWGFSMYKGNLASRQKVYNNLYSINKNTMQEDKQKGSHAGKRNGQGYEL